MLPRSVSRGRVDQAVEPAEHPVGLCHDPAHLIELGQLGRHEQRLRAGRLQFRADALAAFAAAPGDDDARRPARDQEPRDRLAEPLGAAGHQGDLARELLWLRRHVRLPSGVAGRA